MYYIRFKRIYSVSIVEQVVSSWMIFTKISSASVSWQLKKVSDYLMSYHDWEKFRQSNAFGLFTGTLTLTVKMLKLKLGTHDLESLKRIMIISTKSLSHLLFYILWNINYSIWHCNLQFSSPGRFQTDKTVQYMEDNS